MRIDLAGFGPGAADQTTQQVLAAVGEADLIITSARLAETLWGKGHTFSFSEADPSVPYWDVMWDEDRFGLLPGARVLIETVSGKILRILERENFRRAVCLFSGDSSFYSGAAPLLRQIEQSALLQEKGAKVRILPGISSLSAACARMGLSFREIEVFSAHGRSLNVVKAVMNGRVSFFLTGGERDPARLCAELTRAGLGSLKVTVLERMSLPEERILSMRAREAADLAFDSLSVLLTEPAPVSESLRRSVPGIPDDAFEKGTVPMTKRMVRVCALSLLNPSDEDVCWDLGAGCGSVSVELAPHCARVIAVERNPEAIVRMEMNRKKFGAWNMEIVQGENLQVLPDLPAPDRIFIGGGGGQIREILEHFCRKQTRSASLAGDEESKGMPVVCASAVTLETLQEVRCALEDFGYGTLIVQVAVTDVKERGQHHMMDAQNPVFLIMGSAPSLPAGDGKKE